MFDVCVEWKGWRSVMMGKGLRVLVAECQEIRARRVGEEGGGPWARLSTQPHSRTGVALNSQSQAQSQASA